MAERRRRGKDPADDPRAEDLDTRDDALSDEDLAVEDEFADEVDDLDEVDDEDTDDEDRASSNGRRTATKEKSKSTAPDKKSKTKEGDRRRGIFARFVNFFREVVAELRKVIWPTRKELLTYTTVVVVFVVIMLTIVGLLDFGFAKAVLWVFGDKTAQDSE